MTLTKAELADALVKKLNLTKLVAKEIVDDVFETLRFNLERGKSANISGLGNFELRDKKARPGRNPKTGEEALIQARRVVTFKAGQKLKGKVQQYHGENEAKK